MFIKCLSIRSGSLVQIFVRSCFSISCGSHPVYVHLQWHKILKHPFAWSARVLPQLLLHPASLLAAPVPGWVSPLWESRCFVEMSCLCAMNCIIILLLCTRTDLYYTTAHFTGLFSNFRHLYKQRRRRFRMKKRKANWDTLGRTEVSCRHPGFPQPTLFRSLSRDVITEAEVSIPTWNQTKFDCTV